MAARPRTRAGHPRAVPANVRLPGVATHRDSLYGELSRLVRDRLVRPATSPLTGEVDLGPPHRSPQVVDHAAEHRHPAALGLLEDELEAVGFRADVDLPARPFRYAVMPRAEMVATEGHSFEAYRLLVGSQRLALGVVGLPVDLFEGDFGTLERDAAARQRDLHAPSGIARQPYRRLRCLTYAHHDPSLVDERHAGRPGADPVLAR